MRYIIVLMIGLDESAVPSLGSHLGFMVVMNRSTAIRLIPRPIHHLKYRHRHLLQNPRL
jgi:hypothetical protein